MKKHIYPETIWVRTPVIPGATARAENISAIGALISSLPTGAVRRWELCSFNNLCADKYSRLGIRWQFSDTPLIERSFMEELFETAKKSGVNPDIVSWSGNVR